MMCILVPWLKVPKGSGIWCSVCCTVMLSNPQSLRCVALRRRRRCDAAAVVRLHG